MDFVRGNILSIVNKIPIDSHRNQFNSYYVLKSSSWTKSKLFFLFLHTLYIRNNEKFINKNIADKKCLLPLIKL